MRESLRVEALADTIAAEPTYRLAKGPLDVRRRKRTQRIGDWIDVSCSHGQFPRSTNGDYPLSTLKNYGIGGNTRSPGKLALGGKAQEGEIDEGGSDGYCGIEFGQITGHELPRKRSLPSKCGLRSCQGRGRGFESLRPLQFSSRKSTAEKRPSGPSSASQPLARQPGKQGEADRGEAQRDLGGIRHVRPLQIMSRQQNAPRRKRADSSANDGLGELDAPQKLGRPIRSSPW